MISTANQNYFTNKYDAPIKLELARLRLTVTDLQPKSVNGQIASALSSIFERIQEDCQHLMNQGNYNDAYNLYQRISQTIRNDSKHKYRIHDLEKIERNINSNLIGKNSFEKVCEEIEKLKGRAVKERVGTELVMLYASKKDFEHAIALISKYQLINKLEKRVGSFAGGTNLIDIEGSVS